MKWWWLGPLGATVVVTLSGLAQDYISVVEEPTLLSPAHVINSRSRFDVTFLLHNRQQKFKLTLEPNDDVLHASATVRRRGPDGFLSAPEPVDRRAHKVFKGRAYVQRVGRSGYREVGWARVTVRRDGEDPVFVGAFELDGDVHHVQTGRTYRRLRHPDDPDADNLDSDDFMVVWRDSDIVRPVAADRKELRRDLLGGSSCSSDALSYNSRYHPLDTRDEGMMHSLSPSSILPRLLSPRQIDGNPGSSNLNLVANIGSTAGCPTTRRVALMGVATDCTYTAAFDDEQEARQNVIDQVNLASEVYERTFNISLGIQALEISHPDCPASPPDDAPWNVPCGTGTTITDRLNLFSEWRGRDPRRGDTNAFWTLLSTCNTDAAVGLAWLGQLCVSSASTAANADGRSESVAGASVVVRTSAEWQVLAHEIGHTFGAVHDCVASACGTSSSCCPLSRSACDAGGGFIMNPSTDDGISDFSQCSVGNICGAMNIGSTRASCLVDNRDVVTITGSQCGNGIVESGEQCDCGGDDGCAGNPCCDAATCRFVGAAVCDPSNDECCTDGCRLAARGAVCRASTGPCDPQETCPGDSFSCPSNVRSPDGDSCGRDGDGLACASGQCTSRDLQCRNMVGVAANDTGTSACDDTSGCRLCCRSGTFDDPNAERQEFQTYVDGTPCEADGKCYSGSCQGVSIGGQIARWFDENRNIVIPVAAVLGGLFAIALLLCCVSAIRQRVARARALEDKAGGSSPHMTMGPDPSGWETYGGAWGTGSPGYLPPPPARAAMAPENMQMASNQEWRPARQSVRYG